MYTAQLDETPGPFSIRYPRGAGVMQNWKTPFSKLEIGKGRKLREGKKVALVTIGTAGNLAAKAVDLLLAEGVEPAHYDLRFVKPLDEELLHEVFSRYEYVITVEDGCIVGGMGSAVLEFMADQGYHARLLRLGIPDRFIEHGEQAQLYEECGFSPTAIARSTIALLNNQAADEAGKKNIRTKQG
jgi:1-deoxy-D-xylulose-5-phosphate synthase